MIVYSKNLDEIWREEITVSNSNEIWKGTFVFIDKIPKIAELKVRLTGPKSRAEIWVIFLGRREEEISMDIRLIHDAPETHGRVTAKAALFDQSKFLFRGTLEITSLGKGSDSYLSAHGLMVSPQARAEIYPYLEIKTDEVRASHGSSVGQIDRGHLFYLQSRGVDRKNAQIFFLSSFFKDAAERLPNIYREKFFQI